MTTMTDTVRVQDPEPLALVLHTPAAPPAIRTPAEYETVAEGLARNKGWQAHVKAWFAPFKQKAYEAHQAICTRERDTLAPALVDERLRKTALEAWDARQEAARLAEERRLQDLARQAEERRRLEDAAHLEREANLTGDETLRAAAQELVDGPIETPTVRVSSLTPKVAGLRYTDKWETPEGATGVNLRALCAAIGRGEQPVSYVSLNVSAVNRVFQATKGTVTIPGVPCVHRRVPASGRR